MESCYKSFTVEDKQNSTVEKVLYLTLFIHFKSSSPHYKLFKIVHLTN